MGPLVALRCVRVAGLFLALAAGGAALFAYDNDNMSRERRDGPHRVLNRLALDAFWQGASSDPVLSRYDRGRNRGLNGEAVLAGGMVKPSYGDWKGTWEDWVAEGGYTADEPELYASFRHFFDPLALNSETDGPVEARVLAPSVGLGRAPATQGVPYLTDHLNVLTAIWSRQVGGSFNPQINAKEWALYGPENNGWGENPYCWKKGLDYLEQAFASTGPEKQRLFAKAWRSLGETMHLLADMTSPPHVRNDSHPGASGYLGEDSDDVGLLRSDPYETLVREGLILRAARAGPSPLDVSALPADALFDAIAGFTNREVFSADTISGTDPATGQDATNANGMRPYPSPRLEQCIEKDGYYVKRVAGRDVRMAHRSWLSEAGWGEPMNRVKLSGACAEDQAALLIPLAVAGGARLVDLFLPRVKVEIEDVDEKEKRLRGKVVHVPYGALTRPLTFSAGDGDLSSVYVNGGLQDWDKYEVSISGGTIDVDLSSLDPKKGQTIRLDVEVGGIVIRSNEARVTGGDEKKVFHHRGCWSEPGAPTTVCTDYDVEKRGPACRILGTVRFSAEDQGEKATAEMTVGPKGRLEGPYVLYVDGGAVAVRGGFLNGEKDALWSFFWPNGQKRLEAEYKAGELHGRYSRWHENGQAAEEARFSDGSYAGERREWNDDGSLWMVGTYGAGSYTEVFYDRDGKETRRETRARLLGTSGQDTGLDILLHVMTYPKECDARQLMNPLWNR